MRKLLRVAALCGALCLFQAPGAARTARAADDCFPPGVPGIPDGNTASYPEMVRSGQQVKLLRESAEAYSACMAERFKRLGTRVPERRRERWLKEQQKVSAAVQSATERYNESVRAFKAKTGSEPKPDAAEPEKNQDPAPPPDPAKTKSAGKPG